MLALSISGIDLKTFAISSYFIEENKNILISLDANKKDNILLFESSHSLNLEDIDKYISLSQENVEQSYKRFQRILMEKLSI
jgi:hypothetical protein